MTPEDLEIAHNCVRDLHSAADQLQAKSFHLEEAGNKHLSHYLTCAAASVDHTADILFATLGRMVGTHLDTTWQSSRNLLDAALAVAQSLPSNQT